MKKNNEDPSVPGPQPNSDSETYFRLLTPTEFARQLQVSLSWLAKARMRGDGPPFVKIGRAVRYPEVSGRKWIEAQNRISTFSGK